MESELVKVNWTDAAPARLEPVNAIGIKEPGSRGVGRIVIVESGDSVVVVKSRAPPPGVCMKKPEGTSVTATVASTKPAADALRRTVPESDNACTQKDAWDAWKPCNGTVMLAPPG